MRAVQISLLGGPKVLDVVDLPDPVRADGEQLYEVSSAGINYADTHHFVTFLGFLIGLPILASRP